MKEEKEVKISFWAAHITTIVSVTLLLLIIGVIAAITLSAGRETRRLKEQIEISVVMNDSVDDATAEALGREISAQPYALNVCVVSRQQALEAWKNDTGEDLEKLFGVNPLSPEVAFSVKSEYADKENLNKIRAELSQNPDVEEVALPNSTMVEDMNSTIETLAMILGCVAIVLVFISFILINNTVHLAIYSRRFTIHTMQLVGATNGFIRRPVVGDNMLAGAIAGILASAIMALSIWIVETSGVAQILNYVNWIEFAVIAVSLICLGAMLCAFAAMVSTTRYLRKDYEQLFK